MAEHHGYAGPDDLVEDFLTYLRSMQNEDTTLAEHFATKVPHLQDSVSQLVSVTACNRNQPGLQSARFWDHINCIYRPAQDHIICN
jgi:hypothetical protein